MSNYFAKRNTEKIITPHKKIKEWAKSTHSSKDMIEFYDKYKGAWENKEYIIVNVEQMILKLSRFKKYETLEYIFSNNPNYKQIFSNSKKSPLNEAIWINDEYENTGDICNKIINTIKILLNNNFNFLGITEFDDINNDSKIKRETFLDSLLHPLNKLDEKKKIELYIYFTQQIYNESQFKKSLVCMINKCSFGNIHIFKEKILYLLTKDVSQMTKIIFEQIISQNSNSDYLCIIAKVILSSPEKSCFDNYFSSIELDNIREQTCCIILENFEELIKNKTNSQLKINIDEIQDDNSEEYKQIVSELHCNSKNENHAKFCRLMAIYYNNNIKKTEIIDIIFNDENIDVKATLRFIENIDEYKKYSLFSLPVNLPESRILFEFLKKRYTKEKASIKYSIQTSIEKIFNIKDKERVKTDSYINEFINNFNNNNYCYYQKTKEKLSVENDNISYEKTELLDFEGNNKLVDKYRLMFVDYIKKMKDVDIKKDIKIIEDYFGDIKYLIESNEQNIDYKDDRMVLNDNHINNIIIGFTHSLDEINLDKNNLKIAFVIKYLSKIINNDLLNKIKDFMKTEKFDEITSLFDNPTINKFLKGFEKFINKSLN